MEQIEKILEKAHPSHADSPSERVFSTSDDEREADGHSLMREALSDETISGMRDIANGKAPTPAEEPEHWSVKLRGRKLREAPPVAAQGDDAADAAAADDVPYEPAVVVRHADPDEVVDASTGDEADEEAEGDESEVGDSADEAELPAYLMIPLKFIAVPMVVVGATLWAAGKSTRRAVGSAVSSATDLAKKAATGIMHPAQTLQHLRGT